jgi:hypothetical protein
MLCKRLFLTLLKIQTGRAAWLFSLVSALAMLVISHGVPLFAAFLLF